ncbi:MAG: glycosyltransferase family 39 protein [Elusimicrobiota bacterium]
MRRLLPLVLATAGLALRLGYGWRLPPSAPAGGLYDPDYYVRLARSVADSWSLEEAPGKPSSMREPGFSVLLGLAMKALGKGRATVVLVNSALSLGAMILIFALGRRLFGETTALIALGIAAFYPAFIYHCAQPMRETALTFAGPASVWVLLEARARGSAAWFAGAGAVNALAALVHTVFLPFGLILAPAALFLLRREKTRETRRLALAYLCVFACVYASWPLRNYAVFGRLIFGSTASGGSTFYAYLVVPQELGGLPEQGRILAEDPVVRAWTGTDPVDREKYFFKEGVKRVARFPLSYLKLVAWRFFVDIWRIIPRDRPAEHPRRLLVWVSLLSDGWILPLALVGLLLARLTPPEMLWPYLLLFSVNGVYALFLTLIRYRLTAMPWAILLAAYAIARGWERVREVKHAG